jgi:hypothetical protein
MSIIQCAECNGKVSNKATACPHCGAPIHGAVEARNAGAALTTTQNTSKRIKLISLTGAVLTGVGIGMGYASMTANPEDGGGGWFVLGILGLLIYIYARIKRWWHHA